MYRKLKLDFTFTDERGSLLQLVHHGYTQVNVITTKRGVERGGHFHRRCREAFYVISGSVSVTMTSNGRQQKTVFKSGDFFEIPPMVLHEMFYPEACVMVALYDQPVESATGEKDIYRPDPDDSLWKVRG